MVVLWPIFCNIWQVIQKGWGWTQLLRNARQLKDYISIKVRGLQNQTAQFQTQMFHLPSIFMLCKSSLLKPSIPLHIQKMRISPVFQDLLGTLYQPHEWLHARPLKLWLAYSDISKYICHELLLFLLESLCSLQISTLIFYTWGTEVYREKLLIEMFT